LVKTFLESYIIFDHDWVDEKALIKEMGVDYCNEVKKKLVDYYVVLNHLCSIGQVEKMYIPPAMDLSKGIIANQTLYEQKVARDIQVKKGEKVLDIGCGRGRVASHIAGLTGAHVTGVNIDDCQIKLAQEFALRNGLTDQCNFVYGDMNVLPFAFPDASFDAIYEVQVFSYSKNLEKMFKEVARLLKKGGRLSCLEWVVFDKFDPKNPEHDALMKKVKPVIGAIGNPSIDQYIAAMKKAGFKILENKNISIDGLQAPLIEQADKFYTRLGRFLNFLVKVKILPAHFTTLFERLSRGGQAFVEADRKRLATTSHYFLAEKL
jgi:sterol 24-C-methyltransferase